MSDQPAHDSPHATATPDPQSVEGLFLAALGHASTEERESFLNEACGNDVERRRRVEALLRAYDDAGSFLENSPINASGTTSFNLDFLTPSDDPGLLGTLGPYEVYEVLGRGGMGIVFRARDPKLNRVVAIKVLAPELAANPLARRRFLREAQAAAAISHPHVATIHAVDEGAAPVEGRRSKVEGQANPSTFNSQPSTLPYLVMECIVGQTLQQKLDKVGSLRLTEILRIGHQVACGLAAAHKQGLIHRDIKPANVLLENGVERVKITDFGLARLVDDVSITRTGEVSGTPQYMSPEQAAGDPVDHRSDLFSLGCVLYAMCTGRSPFRATSLAAAIRRVCDDEPRPIEEINPEVPTWLIGLINQLLEKNPEERTQSAEEVADVLGERLSSLQQPGRATESEPIAQPAVSRRRQLSESLGPATDTASSRPREIRLLGSVVVWVGVLIIACALVYGVAHAYFSEAIGLAGPPMVEGRDIVGKGLAVLVAGTLLLLGGLLMRGQIGDRTRLTIHLFGRIAVVLGITIIAGVLVAFVYVALGFPNLPPFAGHDFGTVVIPILLVASWLLLSGIVLQGKFRGPSRSSVKPKRTEGSPRWDIRRVGRSAIWAGLGVIVLPWLIIAFGFLIGDGDPMEFGGRLVFPAAVLGVLTIMMGCITLLVAYSVGQRHSERDAEQRPLRERVHDRSGSSWNAVGWLSAAALVVIPLVLVLWVAAYLSQEKAQSRQQALQAARGQRVQMELEDHRREAAERHRRKELDEDGFPKPRTIPLAKEPHMVESPTGGGVFTPPSPNDRVGFLQVDIRDDGLVVALRRKSAFGGFIRESEQQVSDVGFTELLLSPGEYEVLIRDNKFGWGEPRKKSLTVSQQPIEFVVQRDLKEYVKTDAERDADFLLSADPFLWNGEAFSTPNGGSRLVLNWLLEAYAAGDAAVDESELLIRLIDFRVGPIGRAQSLLIFGKSFHREGLTELFQDRRGIASSSQPAWGELIIPGEKEGTYRLAPVPRGILKVTVVDEGLQATVRAVDPEADVDPRQVYGGTQTWELPPGEYDVEINDTAVGWRDSWGLPFAGGFDRSERVVVRDGEETPVEIRRDFADVVEAPDGKPVFHWLSRSERFQRHLQPDQIRVVEVLLQVLADGKPEVPETELLQRAGVEAESMEDVFPHINEPTLDAWNGLLVRGKTDGTWRLTPPPGSASNENSDAPDQDSPPPPPMPEDGLPEGESLGHRAGRHTCEMCG